MKALITRKQARNSAFLHTQIGNTIAKILADEKVNQANAALAAYQDGCTLNESEVLLCEL